MQDSRENGGQGMFRRACAIKPFFRMTAVPLFVSGFGLSSPASAAAEGLFNVAPNQVGSSDLTTRIHTFVNDEDTKCPSAV
jgi:hypothetical protein